MVMQFSKRWPTILLAIFMASIATGCGKQPETRETGRSDQFETIGAYIQNWLTDEGTNAIIMSSSRMKDIIINDSDEQHGNLHLFYRFNL